MTKMIFCNHLKWYVFVLSLLIPAGFSAAWVFGADSDHSDVGISVKAEDETLSNVLAKISQASGYKIEFDQEWGDHPVNIQFEHEPLENALNRVLASLNHALIWIESEKKISIFISGANSARGSKQPPSVGSSSPVSSGSEVRRRPISGRSERRSSQSSNEIRSTSPPTSTRPSDEQIPQPEEEVPVSVTGRKTRFGQGTSTID